MNASARMCQALALCALTLTLLVSQAARAAEAPYLAHYPDPGGNGDRSCVDASNNSIDCPDSAPAAGVISLAAPEAVSQIDSQTDFEGRKSGCPLVMNPADGTPIGTTVFMPETQPGETYPVIIYSHGWGGSRATDPTRTIDYDELFGSIDGLLVELWQSGYIILSFDERGWGQSKDGQVRGIDPSCESADAAAVLDWAEANLPVAKAVPAFGGPADLVAGGVGGSYGGGFQMMLASQDARLDAIVPMGTWTNIGYSLMPHDVVKRSFASLLCGLGYAGGATYDPIFNTACAFVVAGPAGSRGPQRHPLYTANGIPDDFGDLVYEHGIQWWANQLMDQGIPPANPAINALFIQGHRDVLFNFNESEVNYNYYSKFSSGDVRLISNQSGHMNPLAKQVNSLTSCGRVDMWSMTRDWFDAHLKGQLPSAAGVQRSPSGDYSFKPRCKGCKVEGSPRTTKPRCKGCKVARPDGSTGAARIRAAGEAANAARARLNQIQEICFSLDDNNGLEMPALPGAGSYGQVEFPVTQVDIAASTLTDVIGGLGTLPNDLQNCSTGTCALAGQDLGSVSYSTTDVPSQKPMFLELYRVSNADGSSACTDSEPCADHVTEITAPGGSAYTATHPDASGLVIAGIPEFSALEVTTLSTAGVPILGEDLSTALGSLTEAVIPPDLIPATALVGVGIERTNENGITNLLWLDEQVTAFPAGAPDPSLPGQEAGMLYDDAHGLYSSDFGQPDTYRLPGVAEVVEYGDKVGILLWTEHPQFEFGSVNPAPRYQISGTLDMPIFPESVGTPTDKSQSPILKDIETERPCVVDDPVGFVYSSSTCLDEATAVLQPPS